MVCIIFPLGSAVLEHLSALLSHDLCIVNTVVCVIFKTCYDKKKILLNRCILGKGM